MTVTPNIFGFGPIFYEGDAGGGAGAGGDAPVVDAPVVDAPVGDAAPDAAALAAAAAAAGDAPVDAPVSTDEPVVEGGDGDAPDESGIPEHLRPYVKQLREEAAERRVAAKVYEEAFGAFDEGDREALLGVVAALGSEDTQLDAAQALKELAESILGDVDDPDRPLTARDLERREAAKAEAQRQEEAVNAVIKEATDLGYAEGTREQRRLLDLAVNETKGDLKAAHEAITAERDAVIAEFVKSVQEGKAKWPTLAPPPGVAPADITGGPPKTFAEARKATEARARARAASAM